MLTHALFFQQFLCKSSSNREMLFQLYNARSVEEQISLDGELLNESLNYDDLQSETMSWGAKAIKHSSRSELCTENPSPYTSKQRAPTGACIGGVMHAMAYSGVSNHTWPAMMRIAPPTLFTILAPSHLENGQKCVRFLYRRI